MFCETIKMSSCQLYFCRVNSFFNDASLGRMRIWPYRASSEDKKLILRPWEFYFFSDEIGGEVMHDLTIRARAAPYVVDRSIVVRLVS